MNLAIFPFNRVLAGINLSITIVLIVMGCLLVKNYESYVFKISEDIKDILGEDSRNLINSVPTPIVVLSSDTPNNLVFYNSKFKENFIDKVNYSEFVNRYGEIFREIIKKNTGSVIFGGRNFKVLSEKNKDFVILYFIDNTEFKNLKKKYSDTRPCVGFVVFDNRDELYRYADDEQNSQILVAVEGMLRDWMAKSQGIFKKLSSGKYFVVFEEKYLKQFISEKFKIIDKIHSAQIDEHRYATVSIGISRGAENLFKAKNEAARALDMALGR